MKKKIKDTRGMTLIELIVGLAISSVVSLMAAQFFSSAARLHRSSTELSNIQKDGQTLTNLFNRSIMNTNEIFYCRIGEGLLVMFGREDEKGQNFEGEVYYYDKAEKKIYADLNYRDTRGRDALFTTIHSKSETERLKKDEYQLSNKIENLEIYLSPELTENERTGANTYSIGEPITLTVKASLQHRESHSYEYRTKAMPRGRVEEITWIR